MQPSLLHVYGDESHPGNRADRTMLKRFTPVEMRQCTGSVINAVRKMDADSNLHYTEIVSLKGYKGGMGIRE